VRPIATTKLPPCPPQNVLALWSQCLDNVETVTGELPSGGPERDVYDLAVQGIRATQKPDEIEQLLGALREAETLDDVINVFSPDKVGARVSAARAPGGGNVRQSPDVDTCARPNRARVSGLT